ncbi:MAG: hypothetical protein N4A48_03740 [Tepidibacter sp.]|jgi:hypothetical protein|uniref:hypothetical protein n=1 Tax=Tepidibacter sp. TaxID=2529387 RepID=UPI0025D1F491|nr:hypothetical protein [Tepidibacter sp.]MCT4507861.1 hypothetical protein [Tepidibacter sp.]
MKKLVASMIIGGTLLLGGMTCFASVLHSPECGGTVYSETICRPLGHCVTHYYCTECGEI